MKIAFHVPRASQLNPGGSGDRVLVAGILSGLRARGHDVQVLTEVNVRRYWRGERHVASLGLDVLRVATRVARMRPDGWFVYGASTMNPDLFGWWMRPARYVLYSADVGSGRRLPERWRSPLAAAHRRSLRRADAVTAYHPRSADQLVEAGVPPERLRVLVPATRVPAAVEDRSTARRRLGLPAEGPIALTVARLALGDKTTMALRSVQVIAEVPAPAMLVIVGDGPGRPEVAEMAASLGVEDRLLLAGSVPHADVATYMAACDLLLYPHPADRPWLAVLEAQAHGRPVVLTDSRSARLTVEDGATGLLGSAVSDLARFVRKLFGDVARREAMGERARAYVMARHSIEQRLDDIEELLRAPASKASAAAT